MVDKPILIIDGNALMYKSLITKKEGEKPLGFRNNNNEFIRTGMPYGLLVNIIFLIKEFDPKNIIMVWDSGSDRRLKIFPNYKKNRKEKYKEQKKIDDKFIKENSSKKDFIPPFNFHDEVQRAFEIAKHIGIQQYKTSGEEGDDLIATIVSKIDKKEKIVICSNDHDFKQLLQNKNVKMFFSLGFKKIFNDYDSFVKKFNFEPKYYRNFLALCGDKTDEYYGVPKIGEKRAIKIINEYGPTLKKIFKNAERKRISLPGFPDINEAILKNKDLILLNKKIATLYDECNLDKLESTYDINELKKVLKKFKFHSMLFNDKLEIIKNLPRKKLEL